MELVLRCTLKVQNLLGTPGVDLKTTDEPEWYANLLWIERKKCILFTEALTLFSFLVPDIRKADVTPMGQFFAFHLSKELGQEGLPSDAFGVIDPDRVIIAKTASRSVLGSMNDLGQMSERVIRAQGGLEHYSPVQLNRSLRRIPMTAIGPAYPIDKVLDRLNGRR